MSGISSSVSGTFGAESRFEGISGELRHSDDEGGRGTERGNGEGSALGAIAGLAAGAVIDLTQQKSTPTEDVDDDEDEGFEITM